MLIRHCPRCRSDFQPHILRCLDCDGPTEERDDELAYPEDDTLPPAPAEPERLDDEGDGRQDDWDDDEDDDEDERVPGIAPGVEVVLVRTAEFGWIQDLGAALARAQIPVKIVEQPNSQQFALLVRVEDGPAAGAIDRELYLSGLREELPTLPEERHGACPACGTDVPAGDPECPECGLVVAGPEEAEDDEAEAKTP